MTANTEYISDTLLTLTKGVWLVTCNISMPEQYFESVYDYGIVNSNNVSTYDHGYNLHGGWSRGVSMAVINVASTFDVKVSIYVYGMSTSGIQVIRAFAVRVG